MKKRKLFTVVTAIATVFATTIATSACLWYLYQPQEPKCLENKWFKVERLVELIHKSFFKKTKNDIFIDVKKVK